MIQRCLMSLTAACNRPTSLPHLNNVVLIRHNWIKLMNRCVACSRHCIMFFILHRELLWLLLYTGQLELLLLRSSCCVQLLIISLCLRHVYSHLSPFICFLFMILIFCILHLIPNVYLTCTQRVPNMFQTGYDIV